MEISKKDAESCICTIKTLRDLAYNIHGVMDWIDRDNCRKIIKMLESITEIPTPHGRLIDADKLEEGFKRAIGTYLPKDPTRHMSVVDASICRGWVQGLTAVQEAETVIEAEEGE